MFNMRNDYAGMTVDQLLPIKAELLEARRQGSLTSTGIEPRISHQFKGLSYAEIDRELQLVGHALYLCARAKYKQDGTTDLLELYPNPFSHSRITRPIFTNG